MTAVTCVTAMVAGTGRAARRATVLALAFDDAAVDNAVIVLCSHRFSPAAELDAYQPGIDASSPHAATDGLLRCLAELQAQLAGHPELLQFRARRRGPLPWPHRRPEGNPARRLLTRAFEQARGQLRDDVSIDAEAIGLLGMLLMLATWRSRHWTDLSDEQVTGLLTARLRPLFRSPRDPEEHNRQVTPAGTALSARTHQRRWQAG